MSCVLCAKSQRCFDTLAAHSCFGHTRHHALLHCGCILGLMHLHTQSLKKRKMTTESRLKASARVVFYVLKVHGVACIALEDLEKLHYVSCCTTGCCSRLFQCCSRGSRKVALCVVLHYRVLQSVVVVLHWRILKSCILCRVALQSVAVYGLLHYLECYGEAMISRLLQNIGLFCRI